MYNMTCCLLYKRSMPYTRVHIFLCVCNFCVFTLQRHLPCSKFKFRWRLSNDKVRLFTYVLCKRAMPYTRAHNFCVYATFAVSPTKRHLPRSKFKFRWRLSNDKVICLHPSHFDKLVVVHVRIDVSTIDAMTGPVSPVIV